MPVIHAALNGLKCLDMLIDTGSSVNIVSEEIAGLLPGSPKITPTVNTITAFGGAENVPLGTCILEVSYRGCVIGGHLFYVIYEG